MTTNPFPGTFAALPVVAYPPPQPPEDPGGVVWWVAFDESAKRHHWRVRLSALAAEPWAGEVTALLVRDDGYHYPPDGKDIAAAVEQLPALRALAVGRDTFGTSCYGGWDLGDVTPLLTAAPGLETLLLRGAGKPATLTPLRHVALRTLVVQVDGLPAAFTRAVAACDLPALTHLELWPGVEECGGDTCADDLRPILDGTRLPALTSLTLRGAQIADQIAGALADAPIMSRLTALDLSHGCLTDTGAGALLAGRPPTGLRHLDLRRHHLTPRMQARLTETLGSAGVRLDLGNPLDPDASHELWLHRSILVGRPVLTYPHPCTTVDPGAVAWRVASTPPDEDIDFVDDEGRPVPEILAELANEEWAGRVTALILGNWGAVFDNPPPIAELAALAPRLPALRVVELGDIHTDDYHHHFIAQGDVTPLLEAWPDLEVLWVRGGGTSGGLRGPVSVRPVRHLGLRVLTLETIGLQAHVVRAVADSDLPNLTRLELWLGGEDTNGDATMADLAPILDGTRLPALTTLALCNAELANRIAAALPDAPIGRRLEHLDLSYGTLYDAGAEHLLTPGALPRLRTLNVAHHFLSPEMEERLTAGFAERGCAVWLADSQHASRFAASGEADEDDDEADEDDEGLDGRYIGYNGDS